jgi:hypothetical protein
MTQLQIQGVLKRETPSLTEFQVRFEQAAKFERVLAESFGSERVNDAGETVWQPASEFIGTIGASFAAHTDLYLLGEEKYLQKLILRARTNIKGRKQGIIDGDNKLLKSGVSLVQHMKISIERCGEFSVGSALYKLFFIMKDAITNYVGAIGETIPTKFANDGDFRLVSVISNTTHYFFSIVEGLARRIQKSVSEDEKRCVDVRDLQDTLQDAIGSQLTRLSMMTCDETKPILDSIVNGGWQTGTEETTFKWHINLCTLFARLFGLAKRWLCEDNFCLFRNVFVSEWGQKLFDAAFRVKPMLTSDGTERLGKATKMIKELFLEKFVTPTGNEQTTDIQRRMITQEFGKVDNGCKVVNSPEEVMVELYLQLFDRPSKDQFMLLVRSKGTAQSRELEALYLAAVRKK